MKKDDNDYYFLGFMRDFLFFVIAISDGRDGCIMFIYCPMHAMAGTNSDGRDAMDSNFISGCQSQPGHSADQPIRKNTKFSTNKESART